MEKKRNFNHLYQKYNKPFSWGEPEIEVNENFPVPVLMKRPEIKVKVTQNAPKAIPQSLFGW